MQDELLAKLTNLQLSQAEALALFDQLPSVEVEFMLGEWRGEEVNTGHQMEGLLTASNWYGKTFKSTEQVFPLIFKKNNGVLYAGNPGKILVGKNFAKIPRQLVKNIFPWLYIFISTEQSGARLRQINFRQTPTAAMIYDQLPIIDVFKQIDQQTVLGLMDYKHDPSANSYFFILHRL